MIASSIFGLLCCVRRGC